MSNLHAHASVVKQLALPDAVVRRREIIRTLSSLEEKEGNIFLSGVATGLKIAGEQKPITPVADGPGQ